MRHFLTTNVLLLGCLFVGVGLLYSSDAVCASRWQSGVIGAGFFLSGFLAVQGWRRWHQPKPMAHLELTRMEPIARIMVRLIIFAFQLMFAGSVLLTGTVFFLLNSA